jgi:Ca2+-binding EF-hand superfamily protein
VKTFGNRLKKADSEHDSMILSLFKRYDIDNSGTMNTAEEFHALTLNLLFKLKMRQPLPMLTEKQLSERIDQVGKIGDQNAWGGDQYSAWFKNEFPVTKK